jgi:steroid Delta-isomerase
MNEPDLDARVDAYARFFEELTPERLRDLDTFFAPDARFRDPFNDVRGVSAIRAVFEHMYRVCPEPRFRVLERARDGHTAFCRWHFTDGPAGGRRMALNVDGVSRVVFDADGRVTEHVDYWDPCANLYERIPVMGTVLRLLRRRLSAGRPT